MLLQQFNKVKSMITEDLATSMSLMFSRMTVQEDGIFDVPPSGALSMHTQQSAVHAAMKISSRKSTNKGFLVWLSPSVVNPKLYVCLFFSICHYFNRNCAGAFPTVLTRQRSGCRCQVLHKKESVAHN